MPDPSGRMTPEEYAADIAAGKAQAGATGADAGGPGAPYEPVPGNPGLYYIPGTNYVVSYTPANPRDLSSRPSLDPLPISVGKALLGDLSVADTSGGGGGRMASDDPRYWQLQYDQLAAQYANMGLDAESARRQALTTLIANRNNTALGIADTSAGVAAQSAKFTAEPSDAYAELLYRNAVGGSTPFGSISSNPEAYEKYGSSLDKKFMELFGGAGADLAKAREYRDQIPMSDFLNPVKIPGMARGGQINFDGMMEGRAKDGYSPASSEGGTNLNIHERAVVVGESGHVYGTLGEKRPDGSVRAEQIIIKPLKSEVEKDKKLAEANKAITETQSQTMKSFAGGGTVTSGIPSPDDYLAELSKALSRLGGGGGGVGEFSSPLPDARLLAGKPWQMLQEDPNLLGLTQAGYKTKQGGTLNPLELSALVQKFTPKGPSYNQRQISF